MNMVLFTFYQADFPMKICTFAFSNYKLQNIYCHLI